MTVCLIHRSQCLGGEAQKAYEKILLKVTRNLFLSLVAGVS